MNYELQFLVMVNSEIGIDELLNKMSGWNDLIKLTHRSFDSDSKNWIQVSENEDYGLGGIQDEDGFLFYKYKIEVSPLNDQVGIDDQVEYAKKIHQNFIDEGFLAEICADFEELL